MGVLRRGSLSGQMTEKQRDQRPSIAGAEASFPLRDGTRRPGRFRARLLRHRPGLALVAAAPATWVGYCGSHFAHSKVVAVDLK